MKFTLAAVLVVFSSTMGVCHSKTHSTTPANGAVLEKAPEVIEILFNAAIRLTLVEAVHADGTRQALDLAGYSDFSDMFSLATPTLGTGAYDIEWRGLGADGHAMTGGFSFTVD